MQFRVIAPIARVHLIKHFLEVIDTAMAPLPQLVIATPKGGTIHKYELTGGKRSFLRFIGCYLGTCKFCNDIDEAEEYIRSIEDQGWILRYSLKKSYN